MNILLSPPVAFLVYIPLVLVIFLFGKKLANVENPSEAKSSVYNNGEQSPQSAASPGYKPFFLIAFFFAILHLGVLVLGSGGFTLITGAYMAGLILALVALILG
jgi:NADH:ubiquinone oxidoreductase subunit 3 (subunit A)